MWSVFLTNFVPLTLWNGTYCFALPCPPFQGQGTIRRMVVGLRCRPFEIARRKEAT